MATHRLSTKLVDVSTDAEQRTFSGWGSVFGNTDLGGDCVMRGAFTKTLAEHRQRGTLPAMFFQHDPSKIPGKWLGMEETDHGLAVKGQLVNTPLGNEVRELLRTGSIDGLSIGFNVVRDDYDRHSGARLLKEISLWEISVCSLPMNRAARVAQDTVKGGDTITAFERYARDLLKLSRREATIYASHCWKQYQALKSGEPVSADWRSEFDERNLIDMLENATAYIRSL